MIKGVSLNKAKKIMEKPSKRNHRGLFWTYDDTYIPNQYISIINMDEKIDHQSFLTKDDAVAFLRKSVRRPNNANKNVKQL